jgi:hypothetical protein
VEANGYGSAFSSWDGQFRDSGCNIFSQVTRNGFVAFNAACSNGSSAVLHAQKLGGISQPGFSKNFLLVEG